MAIRIPLLVSSLVLLGASAANAEAVRFNVEVREDVLGGRSWGLAGAYERLAGRIHFEVDPQNSANRIIRDIDHALLNAAGRVEFSADFYLLKPKDIGAGNGTVLLDVMNRGRKRILRYFNVAPAVNDPRTEADFGDGFLMRQGFTLLYVGWQFDVPRQAGLLRAYVPIATDGDEPIEGLVRSDFVVRQPAFDHSLGDRGHIPYGVVNPEDPRNVLTVRDAPAGVRTVIPRDEWQFGRLEDGRMVADTTRIYLSSGFEPGRIYEAVFVSQAPPIAGLGLAAMRDAVSQVKYSGAGALGIPAGSIERAIAFGDSQAGRYLRHYVHDGFNADEQQRIVFDGLIPHTGSNARGSFNHRFAQPSRAVDASYFYPGDQFPFSDVMQTDPVTGVEDSLLARVSPETTPKIFYTNTSTEYWRLPTALIHTTVDGRTDVPPADTSRIYFFAGTQHVPAAFPANRTDGLRVGNHNDYTWFLRSLLLKLDAWTRDGTLPPESRYPQVVNGTLVELEALEFPLVPQVRRPVNVSRAYRLDYGPEFDTLGIIANEPPEGDTPFPFLVPQVDETGNEIAGIRSPELAVPLATHAGWNPYSPIASQGSYIPLSRTRSEREATGDSRLSVEERYASREEYLGLVAGEALSLIEEGNLLGSDLPAILQNAGKHWDYVMGE
ncbi:MAG: alpha/beta hydrolase domain-containing protein [Rhodospirillaceae bacterium]|nr:alpha/beta hydrolase domain-containing protein [Rhodospirillaceae bacterium]